MLRDAGSGADGEGRAWLTRYTPTGWLQAGLSELSQAELKLAERDRAAGLAGLRRASGMALNGALSVAFRQDWGRSYLDHLSALSRDARAPESVREAAALLATVKVGQAGNVVQLTPPSERARWIDATKTVMAHAYAIVHGRAGRGQPGAEEP